MDKPDRAISVLLLRHARATLKPFVFKLWNTREKKEKRVNIGYISARHGDNHKTVKRDISHLKPYPHNPVSAIRGDYFRKALSALFEAVKIGSPTPIIQVLKLEHFKPKFPQRAKRLIYSYVYDGTAHMRRARYMDNAPPNFINFRCDPDKTYKFYFRDPFTGATRVKKLKTDKNMDRRKALTGSVSRGKAFKPISYNWIVYKVVEIDLNSLTEKIVYEIRTTDHEIRDAPKLKKRVHKPRAYTRIIDYAALMKHYRKMSRAWRLRLLNSIYNKNQPTIPALRRIYDKIVKKVKHTERVQITVKVS